jgi:general secretion pathway protein D
MLCQAVSCLLLVTALSPATFAGGNGKKNFKEGMKFEIAKQWDKAAEQFAQALQEDPGNIEYQLHLQRALFNASVLAISRGRQLEDQKDYEGAYHAYREAYQFDRTNDVAFAKMKEMLKKQGIEPTSKGEPSGVPFQRAADVKKTAELQSLRTDKRYVKDGYNFADVPLKNAIETICREDLRFNVAFEATTLSRISQVKFPFVARNIHAAKALELILDANQLSYYKVDTRTLLVVQRGGAGGIQGGPSNYFSQRYEGGLKLKPFYIKNAKIEDVKGLLGLLSPSAAQGAAAGGAGVQIMPVTQSNMVLVRASDEDLKIIERMILAIDRPQSEVVMDVNIYEVSHNDFLTIGNQFAPTDAATGGTALGGVLQSGLRNTNPEGLFSNVLGASLVIPRSTLNALQTKGSTKLLAQAQLRAFEGQEATVNIGQSVPVQTGFSPTLQGSVPNPVPGNPNGFQNIGLNQIQYRDVGLNISVKPKVTEDVVQMDLKIESSTAPQNVQSLATPVFTQRKVNGTARVRDGENALAATVTQETDQDGRSGIPFLSFVPGVGRLFTSPTRSKATTHIVATITPHIVRGGAAAEDDRSAFGSLEFNPTTFSYGKRLTLEEIVAEADRAELNSAGVNESPLAGAPRVMEPAPGPFTPANATNAGPVPTSPVSANGAAGDGIVRPIAPVQNVPPVGGNQGAGLVDLSLGAGGGSLLAPSPTAPTNAPPPASSGNPQQEEKNPIASNGVVKVILAAGLLSPSVNDTLSVTAILSGGRNTGNISSARLSLQYNPSVLRIRDVKPGRLLMNFEQSSTPGQVTVLASSNDASGMTGSGQVATFSFDVIGVGDASLQVGAAQIVGVNGQVIPTELKNTAMPPVQARRQQAQNAPRPTNGGPARER